MQSAGITGAEKLPVPGTPLQSIFLAFLPVLLHTADTRAKSDASRQERVPYIAPAVPRWCGERAAFCPRGLCRGNRGGTASSPRSS